MEVNKAITYNSRCLDPTHIHEEAILLSTDIHEVEVTELSSMGEMKKKKKLKVNGFLFRGLTEQNKFREAEDKGTN